ncbi:hypothetical protein KBD81_01745 [Candidatus Woesebacteria bacterium]|nr:hypothetical protein [Candidatus Woesebacteria bacterium]
MTTFQPTEHNFTPLHIPEKPKFGINFHPVFPKKLIMVFVGLVATGFFGWYINTYVYKFLASNQSASITAVEQKISAKAGTPFTVTFNISPNIATDIISGAEFELSYDPTYLSYGTDGKAGFVPLKDGMYDVVNEENDAEKGTVSITLVNISPDEYDAHQLSFKFETKYDLTNEQIYALTDEVNVLLKQNQELVGEVSGAAVEFDGESNDILLASVSLIPEEVNEDSPLLKGAIDANLIFKATFQGIIDTPRGPTKRIIAAVKISGSSGGSQTFSIPFEAQAGGVWQATQQVKGISNLEKFTITLKGSKHLSKTICSARPVETVGGTYQCNGEEGFEIVTGDNQIDLTNIVLLAGDLPKQNGVVDSADIVYIRENFGNTNSDVLSRGDLNMDGIVDTQDYAMVLAALGFKYDESL